MERKVILTGEFLIDHESKNMIGFVYYKGNQFNERKKYLQENCIDNELSYILIKGDDMYFTNNSDGRLSNSELLKVVEEQFYSK
jgi:hypothetical protein